MNIQFMTKANVVQKKGIYGEDKIEYLPDYDELIKNASCEEEVEMLKGCKERQSTFAFEIVYTIYTSVLDFNIETREQKWIKKWTLYQHPWYRTYEGVYDTKDEMIKDIEKTAKEFTRGA